MDAWVRFGTGLLAGCWSGAIIGAAIVLLFVSRRIRQLETVNELLRLRIRARERASRPAAGAGGTTIEIPNPNRRSGRSAGAAMPRMASGDR